jgi:hypothetical protein
MFEIHHRRSATSKNDRVVIKTGLKTVVEAGKARQVSGDLVVHAGTHEIVRNRLWFFKWELKDKDCYAQRAIRS